MAVMLAALPMAACAGEARRPSTPAAEQQSAEPAPAPNSTVQAQVDPALRRARELRQHAEAIRFAPPSGSDGSREALLSAVGEFLAVRERAAIEAARAYAAALATAAPKEQVALQRELGDLHLGSFDTKVEAGMSARRAKPGEDPQQAAGFRHALRRRFSGDSAAAEKAYTACAALAKQLGVASPDSAHCETQVRTFAALKPPPKSKQQLASEEWGRAAPTRSKRARRTTTQTRPCVFNGSASASSTKLFAEPSGSRHDVRLSDFDVVALELPKHADGRIKLSIDYPFPARGYVDASAGLIEMAERLDLIKPHIWLEPGMEVLAFDASNGQVSIERDHNAKNQPTGPRRVTCRALTMAGQIPIPDEAEGERSELGGLVLLRAGAGGKTVGQLDAEEGINVRVLQRTGGWARVTSVGAQALTRLPFAFDAWVSEELAPRDRPGLSFSGGFVAKAPSHITKAALALRLVPDPSAPVVAELVAGVGLVLGAEQADMRRIRIHEAQGNNEAGDFWVVSTELTKAVASSAAAQ